MLNGSDVFRIHRRLYAPAIHAAESKIHRHGSQVWTVFRLTVYRSVLLMTCFCLLSVIVLTGARTMNVGRDQDPFAHYNVLQPVQSAKSPMVYGCHLQRGGTSQLRDTYCNIDPVPEKFDGFSVTIQDGIIQMVWMGANDLQVADLVHQWGRPDVITRKARFFILKWHNGVVAIARGGGWFQYRLSVESVFVTSEFR